MEAAGGGGTTLTPAAQPYNERGIARDPQQSWQQLMFDKHPARLSRELSNDSTSLAAILQLKPIYTMYSLVDVCIHCVIMNPWHRITKKSCCA